MLGMGPAAVPALRHLLGCLVAVLSFGLPLQATDGAPTATPIATAASSNLGDPDLEVGVILKASADAELIRGNQPMPAQAGRGIWTGDILRTGPAAGLLLRFDRDGGIELGPSSRIRVLTADDLPGCQGNLQVVSGVSLEEGILWILHDSTSGPGIAAVRTTSAVICLLGTRVAVKADPRGTTQVQVWEGSVEVSLRQPDEPPPPGSPQGFPDRGRQGARPRSPLSLGRPAPGYRRERARDPRKPPGTDPGLASAGGDRPRRNLQPEVT